ncbi:3'-5' exonuclease [Alcanivorax sp. 1008]|uniref:3'-5' exonuclease n=1 Tax=Alcanivorax sp. 1008 TaxID=2816853 RepID=UPI001D4FC03D|nr:3'-5' exonuclease [Alcanivorax sp. 1008]MCC1498270.1 UvrD-helicase domain-containing protein [Alcanivorax sp. 1008]
MISILIIFLWWVMKVIQVKALNKCFRDLSRSGKKGKDVITKVRAAMSEAGTEGEITSLKRTNHGESRIPNAEKYDLGDGYRLVVQLVDGKEKIRAFLFAGTHDDAENWLESHKDYHWIMNPKDQTLEFVKVSSGPSSISSPMNLDLETPIEMMSLPLLRHAKKDELLKICDSDLVDYAFTITSEKWEEDSVGVIDYIDRAHGSDSAILYIDLFSLSHDKKYQELLTRIELALGDYKLAGADDMAEAIESSSNSEIFVTWEDVVGIPDDASWADWLLFLHPKQKEISVKNFNGPARLRGVSGSGKTCVMLHRARHLVKKYKQPIVLVTLTESMRKLLDSLVKELCGVESSYISTFTINSFSEKVIHDLHPKGAGAFTRLRDDVSVSKSVLSFVQGKIIGSKAYKFSVGSGLSKFVEDEISHIRTRLMPSQYDDYLDAKKFRRIGRGSGLGLAEREIFLEAARYKDEQIKGIFQLDYEAVVVAAAALLSKDKESLAALGWRDIDMQQLDSRLSEYHPFRAILVDEVQDLSQIEISMLGKMPVFGGGRISSAEDGLFLVGDGAQTIYKKGFVLKSCGVNVANRSFVLKKNYRNTREIMAASYALIKDYQYADVDEDNVVSPTQPDFPARTGERPALVKCRSVDSQIEFISGRISEIVGDYRALHDDPNGCPEICVIGLNSRIREAVKRALEDEGVAAKELRINAGDYESNSVSISTIETAKGHEFRYVFIVGVQEGVIPAKGLEDDEIARDASRLYVAMTRACDSLYLTYTSDKENQASRFLLSIQEFCNEFEYKGKSLIVMD